MYHPHQPMVRIRNGTVSLRGCPHTIAIGYTCHPVTSGAGGLQQVEQTNQPSSNFQTSRTFSGALGIGRTGLRYLDGVVIFKGVPVLYVLRLAEKDEPTWTFIGEWQIHTKPDDVM
jgi:hypothetical protein